MELKGSKTEQNLIAAFAGESEARNKYTYYADRARENGYEQIANLFEITADNEKAHAKQWFELLRGIGTTEENLKDAAAGEHQRSAGEPPEMCGDYGHGSGLSGRAGSGLLGG